MGGKRGGDVGRNRDRLDRRLDIQKVIDGFL